MKCIEKNNKLTFTEGCKVIYEEKSALPDIIRDCVDEHILVEKVLAGSGWSP